MLSCQHKQEEMRSMALNWIRPAQKIKIKKSKKRQMPVKLKY